MKFARFLASGAWNTIFGYSVFAVLYYGLSEKVNYIVILLAANVVSITNAYVCYKIFVFKTKGNYLVEYLRFYLVYGIGIVINIVAFPILVDIVFPYALDYIGFRDRISPYYPYIAQFAILSVTTIVSFLGHNHFSYRKTP